MQSWVSGPHSNSIDRRRAAFLIASGVAGLLARPSFARAAEPIDLFKRAAAGSKVTVDHGAWSALLKAHIKTGSDGLNRVNYAAMKSSGHKDIKNYVALLQTVDPGSLDRAEQFAFLVNLYNAKTVDIVLDKYPVKSIKDISLGGSFMASIAGGPWKAKVLKLAGVELSLDDIEHGILRPLFKEPRVHYAVNCASVGCPNLQPQAFTGSTVEALLDAGAKAYVNSPRGVSITPDGAVVSSIYHWFQEDFGGSERGVLNHLKKYASPELAGKLASVQSIVNHRYDWSLNDSSKTGA